MVRYVILYGELFFKEKSAKRVTYVTDIKDARFYGEDESEELHNTAFAIGGVVKSVNLTIDDMPNTAAGESEAVTISSVDGPTAEGCYHYNLSNAVGKVALTFIEELKNLPECELGVIHFKVLQHRMEVENFYVSYNSPEPTQDLTLSMCQRLQNLVIIAVQGYGGYGRVNFKVEVTSANQYKVYYNNVLLEGRTIV